MSRERELLERAYYVLGELSYAMLKDSGEYSLAGDIYEFLSTPQPTPDEGPVAWMYPDDLERFETNETFAQAYSIKCGSPSQGTTEPLYRHPAPRKPFVRLSEEAIRWEYEQTEKKHNASASVSMTNYGWFYAGARWADESSRTEHDVM